MRVQFDKLYSVFWVPPAWPLVFSFRLCFFNRAPTQQISCSSPKVFFFKRRDPLQRVAAPALDWAQSWWQSNDHVQLLPPLFSSSSQSVVSFISFSLPMCSVFFSSSFSTGETQGRGWYLVARGVSEFLSVVIQAKHPSILMAESQIQATNLPI